MGVFSSHACYIPLLHEGNVIVRSYIKRNVEEEAVVDFKAISRHSPEGTQKNHKKRR
jgi:hypothetical protein